MMAFIFAGKDRVSWRTEERRRQKDIAFLVMLKTATREQLDRLAWENRLVGWKRVAVARAIARLEAT